MYFVFSLTTVMLCWIPNWIFTPEISAGDLIIIVLVPTINLESLVNRCKNADFPDLTANH